MDSAKKALTTNNILTQK